MIIPVVTLMGYWNTMTSMTQICNICIHLLRTWIRSGSDLRFPAVWSAAAEAMLCPCRWFSYPKSWRNQRSWAEHRVAHGNMMHFSLVTSREKKTMRFTIWCFFKNTQKHWHRTKIQGFHPTNQQKTTRSSNFPTLNLSPTKFQRLFRPRVGLGSDPRNGRVAAEVWSARPRWGLKVLLNQQV